MSVGILGFDQMCLAPRVDLDIGVEHGAQHKEISKYLFKNSIQAFIELRHELLQPPDGGAFLVEDVP